MGRKAVTPAQRLLWSEGGSSEAPEGARIYFATTKSLLEQIFGQDYVSTYPLLKKKDGSEYYLFVAANGTPVAGFSEPFSLWPFMDKGDDIKAHPAIHFLMEHQGAAASVRPQLLDAIEQQTRNLTDEHFSSSTWGIEEGERFSYAVRHRIAGLKRVLDMAVLFDGVWDSTDIPDVLASAFDRIFDVGFMNPNNSWNFHRSGSGTVQEQIENTVRATFALLASDEKTKPIVQGFVQRMLDSTEGEEGKTKPDVCRIRKAVAGFIGNEIQYETFFKPKKTSLKDGKQPLKSMLKGFCWPNLLKASPAFLLTI